MVASNFSFLSSHWPILASLGELAERNLHHDPNTTLLKLRLFGETIAKYILASENMQEPEDQNQNTRLRLLKQEGVLDDEVLSIFHALRKIGNLAAHEGYESKEEAATLLSLAYKLGVWFMQTYGDWSYEPEEFKLPADTNIAQHDLREITQAYETKLEKLQEELEVLRKQTVSQEEVRERRKQARKATSQLNLSEAETRKIIDEQLRAAGWEADTVHLRYSKGIRPEKGRNLAIAEWPLKKGFADYALFVGQKLVGIIEAKRKAKDVLSDLEQAKTYAKHLEQKANEEFVGRWGDYQVPFLFATNGRPYLKQFETKSGIWFLDVRKTTNHPRALPAWYTPDGFWRLLQQDEDAANQKLHTEPLDYLNLRDYQLQAIRSVEQALVNGQRNILIAMATGTGKTRTTIGLIYRLVKSGRFNRILFLVDRSALGQQAEDAFKESRLEHFHTFTEIYELKGLTEKVPNPETKVHIATVQGMVKRILFNDDEASIPTVDQYDCIVVDEAHRGYTLDKEMSDLEYQFRDQNDYISKYRTVLDYFDAVKIGLTATPTLHTTEIFGKPVYTYSYREAVIDGYLVDHEPPHQLGTYLKEKGIKWEKGETVQYYDTATGQIETLENLPDEISIEVDQFNKMVITESFNRTVLRELVKYIDPTDVQKTLIFAATDDHADLVVKILKEELTELYGAVEDSAVMKITGSIKDPLQAIRSFKNERLPNIVVTVDLLTTGVDVPSICNLVFLRRVKSRILYEQMIGRATRLCEEIGKTHFNIYDAVGLYGALEKVSSMKPVVVNPKITFTEIADSLNQTDDPEAQKYFIDMIVAKLQRKKRELTQKAQEEFHTLSGGKTIKEFIEWMRKNSTQAVASELKEKRKLITLLDENRYQGTKLFISTHEDKLLYHTRGYGNAEKPEDYLDEFGRFVRENMNKIPALMIVCQKPKELTRQALRELKLELDRQGFTEAGLRTAWREMTNQDIAADIIGFIRQRALGDALISYEERVKKAMQKVYEMAKWTPVQKRWLERIERQLIKEKVLDPDAQQAFEVEPFKRDGGYKLINKIFDGNIQKILDQINESMYA